MSCKALRVARLLQGLDTGRYVRLWAKLTSKSVLSSSFSGDTLAHGRPARCDIHFRVSAWLGELILMAKLCIPWVWLAAEAVEKLCRGVQSCYFGTVCEVYRRFACPLFRNASIQ